MSIGSDLAGWTVNLELRNLVSETCRSALGQLPVEEPPDLPQRILDLGKVADPHDLEDQPVDVGFQFVQPQGQGTLPTTSFDLRGRRGCLGGEPLRFPAPLLAGVGLRPRSRLGLPRLGADCRSDPAATASC